MASITVDGIVKTFGGQQVLRDLSLHIPDGAFYTLLGPSGCGKTTLLRCIAGFHAPDGGRLLFDQDDVTRVSAHRRDIGMVFQDYACSRTRAPSTMWPTACGRAAWRAQRSPGAPTRRSTRSGCWRWPSATRRR